MGFSYPETSVRDPFVAFHARHPLLTIRVPIKATCRGIKWGKITDANAGAYCRIWRTLFSPEFSPENSLGRGLGSLCQFAGE